MTSPPIDFGGYSKSRRGGGSGRPRPSALREAVDQLRALHTPVVVCRGCCSLHCQGTCHWADEYGGELMTVCRHCCIDHFEAKQNDTCLDGHHHGQERGPRAICATIAILDGDPRPEDGVVAEPRVANRETLNPVNPSAAGVFGAGLPGGSEQP